jgi:hypothetical protein
MKRKLKIGIVTLLAIVVITVLIVANSGTNKTSPAEYDQITVMTNGQIVVSPAAHESVTFVTKGPVPPSLLTTNKLSSPAR